MAVGPNGEKKRTMSNETSTACEYLQDMYGNYQLSTFEFKMATYLTVNVTNMTKPSFIVESNFGITDVTIHIKLINQYGKNHLNHTLYDFSLLLYNSLTLTFRVCTYSII